MSVYNLKPRFQTLLRPLAAALFKAGVTANHVTVAACAVSIGLGVGLATLSERSELFLLVPLWLLVRMGLNAIDGMLAREFGQASPLGAYLNELTDVVSDAVLYLPFAFVPGSNAFLIWTIIVLSIISEMAGSLGASIGVGRRYDGPMGKSDRALVFAVVGLLVGASFPMASVLDWIWGAVAALLVLTTINRVRNGLVDRVDS